MNISGHALSSDGVLSVDCRSWGSHSMSVRPTLCVQAQGSNPQGAPLRNVVDVTLEVDAGTPGNAVAVRNQLAALVSGKTYLDVSSLCQLIATHSASQMMCMPENIDAVLHCRVVMVARSVTGHAVMVPCRAQSNADVKCRWPFSEQESTHGASSCSPSALCSPLSLAAASHARSTLECKLQPFINTE